MADHDVHLGRLADEARDRSRLPRGDLRDHAAHPPATDLLVIGERQMQRLLQRRIEHVRHRREAARHIALHVGRSAPVEPAVAFDQPER
jgi:hypothetical protein